MKYFVNSTNLKRRERSFRRGLDDYGQSRPSSHKNKVRLSKKRSPNRYPEVGYNSLLFNEQLSMMEKDLENERKTIEKREEILSNLELQLTSKDGDENHFYNDQHSPQRPSSRYREIESPKIKFKMESDQKPLSRRLFNYPIRQELAQDNEAINQNIRRKKIRRRHLKNCQLVKVTTEANRTTIEGRDSVFLSINKVNVGGNRWKKCKILEIDGISEDWTEEQHESVITEESDPNLNTSSSIDVKPVRESKYLSNNPGTEVTEGFETIKEEPKEETKEDYFIAENTSKSFRPGRDYENALEAEVEENKTKIIQRRKRYEQKMIETKSISESVSLSSNMALRNNLYCCNGTRNGTSNCVIF